MTATPTPEVTKERLEYWLVEMGLSLSTIASLTGTSTRQVRALCAEHGVVIDLARQRALNGASGGRLAAARMKARQKKAQAASPPPRRPLPGVTGSVEDLIALVRSLPSPVADEGPIERCKSVYLNPVSNRRHAKVEE